MPSLSYSYADTVSKSKAFSMALFHNLTYYFTIWHILIALVSDVV